MQTEYVIWGKEPGSNPDDWKSDALLIARDVDGSPITSLDRAKERMAAIATHGCYDMRIQALDGETPDFAATVQI